MIVGKRARVGHPQLEDRTMKARQMDTVSRQVWGASRGRGFLDSLLLAMALLPESW